MGDNASESGKEEEEEEYEYGFNVVEVQLNPEEQQEVLDGFRYTRLGCYTLWSTCVVVMVLFGFGGLILALYGLSHLIETSPDFFTLVFRAFQQPVTANSTRNPANIPAGQCIGSIAPCFQTNELQLHAAVEPIHLPPERFLN